MGVPRWLEKSYFSIIDLVFYLLPQPRPELALIRNCKIISHRGEHDNIKVFENTFEAFDHAVRAGVWGVELDIRWTSDLHPVVVHDADLLRVFNSPLVISEVKLSDLKKTFPVVPTLDEVIAKYGGSTHLMVELKKEDYPSPNEQNETLEKLFSHLKPAVDYHLISLEPEMFGKVPFAPNAALLPVAELNMEKLSQASVSNNYGGFTGHYFMLRSLYLKRHHEVEQKIGTGFINSKNALFRELNREVDWIFSNNAVCLQNFCNPFKED